MAWSQRVWPYAPEREDVGHAGDEANREAYEDELRVPVLVGAGEEDRARVQERSGLTDLRQTAVIVS